MSGHRSERRHEDPKIPNMRSLGFGRPLLSLPLATLARLASYSTAPLLCSSPLLPGSIDADMVSDLDDAVPDSA